MAKKENENQMNIENISKIEKQKFLARMKEKKTSTNKTYSVIVFKLRIALGAFEKCVKISK